MSIRIVHLSDLHYPTIDLATWAAVKQTVVQLRPALIVVSGDLVDQPFDEHLQWARTELSKLETDTGAALCVVPGNHDVFEFGNAVGQTRKDGFERTFRPGMTTAVTLPPPPPPSPKPSMLSRIFGGIGSVLSGTPAPVVAAPPLRSLIWQPPGLPVLVALLDSNPDDRNVAFAGGEVSHSDLNALGIELNGYKDPHLIRIAVVHHHVLPIAHSGGKLVGNEQLMVLRNAGSVLDLLARYRFDLVLHGHKHRTQFARVDLSPGDAKGYPIAVASAGAAAVIERNKPRGCGFNVIDVDDNGRIVVTSYAYGHETPPHPNGDGDDRRTYNEPFPVVMRRAMWRARDRHGIQCRERVASFVITDNGDLLSSTALSGLRRLDSRTGPIRLAHVSLIPPHGRLVADATLEQESFGEGYRIVRDDPNDTEKRRKCWVEVPAERLSGDGGAYRIHHDVANSLSMTQWESEQRQPDMPPTEWIGAIAAYPTEVLKIRLRLPPGFADVQPVVSCTRIAGFPAYRVDDDGNIDVPQGTVFIDDQAMKAHVETGLTYLPATKTWQLTVERPVVGYSYRLNWPLPDDKPAEPIPAHTRAWRRTLLKLGARGQQVPTPQTPQTEPASDAFRELAAYLAKSLRGREGAAPWMVTLFAYDEGATALRPVLSQKSWSENGVNPNFLVKLGEGIAGAAYQQRRPIAWARGVGKSRLIEPVAYVPDPADASEPEQAEDAIFAIPVYHILLQDHRRPSPWGTIGVVSFSSWSGFSEVHPMAGEPPPDASLALSSDVRKIAQGLFIGLLDAAIG